MWVPSLGREDPLEEGMATHSSVLAWRVPRTEEPGGLQSVGWQRVRHDLSLHAHTFSFSQGSSSSFPGPQFFSRGCSTCRLLTCILLLSWVFSERQGLKGKAACWSPV